MEGREVKTNARRLMTKKTPDLEVHVVLHPESHLHAVAVLDILANQAKGWVPVLW